MRMNERQPELYVKSYPTLKFLCPLRFFLGSREWLRYSTTIINAYLVEVLSDYIKTLAEGLDRKPHRYPRRFLMQSNGGVMPLPLTRKVKQSILYCQDPQQAFRVRLGLSVKAWRLVISSPWIWEGQAPI